jgi:hypothetical protein
MGNNFFNYIQQLEMMAFFSGYPLIYFLVRYLISGAYFNNRWNARLVSFLPLAYALTGTLYLILQLFNLYPEFTIENIRLRIQQPYLFTWGLMSILFWIPALSKRPVFSLLHSLVFFFIILKDLFFHFTSISRDRDTIKNDMNVYTVSIFLYLFSFIFLILLSHLCNFRKKHPKH